jgi:XTP/dITP diphosphohydrolase
MTLHSHHLIIATTNLGKAKEFAHRFGQIGIDISSLADYPSLPPVVEDGDTFLSNAEKKARSVAAALNKPVLADDSGLCVQALNNQPGVHSARFAGEYATDEQNVAKLLNELQRSSWVPDAASAALHSNQGFRLLSPASFVCALVVYDPQTDKLTHTEGICPGYIINQPRGQGGFGYDPVFYLPELSRTMAEISLDEKNEISHRAKALDQLMNLFES